MATPSRAECFEVAIDRAQFGGESDKVKKFRRHHITSLLPGGVGYIRRPPPGIGRAERRNTRSNC